MNHIFIPCLAIVIGLAALAWSADRFIDSAAMVARRFGISPLFIGVIIIGFGTSAPELMVSAIAALEGSPALALGNAFGSNIANIGLVLGAAAVICPITTSSRVIRSEIVILSIITLLAGALLLNRYLSRLDGLLLLACFFALLAWSVRKSFKQPPETDALEEQHSDALTASWRVMVWLTASLVLLLASSRLLVWGSVELAMSLGISELVIGLTIVALGTSLPELASVIAAVRKSQHDLALGNILGSGFFNTLAVVGLSATIAPFDFESWVLYRDWLIMFLLVAIILAHTLLHRLGGIHLRRTSGAALISIYIGYLGWLGFTLTSPLGIAQT